MAETDRGIAFEQGLSDLRPRPPQFQSAQVGAGHAGFQPESTLEENQILKPANGMSTADRARQPLQGPGQSVNGQSSDNFQKRLLIGSPYRTYGGN
jgi:hypothetical protein